MKANLFKILEKYDSYFITASKADFIRDLTTTQLNELIGVAAELGIYYKNNHCPKCTLEFMKKLAVPYFEHKENVEKKQAKKSTVQPVEEQQVTEQPVTEQQVTEQPVTEQPTEEVVE